MREAWIILQQFADTYDTNTDAALALNLNYQSLKDCIRRQASTVRQSTIDRVRTVQPHLADQLQLCVYNPRARRNARSCTPSDCRHFPDCRALQLQREPVLCEIKEV